MNRRPISTALSTRWMTEGFVHLSQRPGLGEDINFAYIEANTVSHD